MKFNPIKKEIYSDNGQLIKKLNCPYKIKWENLELTNTGARRCENCDHMILDTELLNENEIIKLVKDNPYTCLKIGLNQQNVKIISNGILEQK